MTGLAPIRRMRTFTAAALLALLAACGGGSEPAATQTTIVISGPEEDPRQPVVVRDFAIEAETIRRGQAVRVRAQLEAARPAQQLFLDWYGPDGWLVAYETRDASAAALVFEAPVRAFSEPGRYRAVLRAGRRPLAEDTVTVTG